jgi:L-glutamine:2-deoxy-scyllo-inosose/3-amino-2,3-dideoxy-scyllo-inosose aminotransferase
MLRIAKNTAGWPQWPQYTPAAARNLLQTLHSRRWTFRGWWTGKISLEKKFAARFGSFLGVTHVALVNSGSTALVAALEALGVGAYDEVVVPGLTWMAVPTAVVRVNAAVVA